MFLLWLFLILLMFTVLLFFLLLFFTCRYSFCHCFISGLERSALIANRFDIMELKNCQTLNFKSEMYNRFDFIKLEQLSNLKSEMFASWKIVKSEVRNVGHCIDIKHHWELFLLNLCVTWIQVLSMIVQWNQAWTPPRKGTNFITKACNRSFYPAEFWEHFNC